MAENTKIKIVKRKLPVFKRQNVDQKKRVGDAWRKPRGIDNKLRIKEGGYGKLPKIGYRNAKATRGLNPSGLREILVYSVSQISSLAKEKNLAIRISATVGKKKRIEFVAEAKKLGFRVLNA